MKKNKRHNKPQHRLKEAQRAQNDIGGPSSYAVSFTDGQNQVSKASTVSESYIIPVSYIKKDLFKNLAYALFVIMIFGVLKVTNFGFSQITSLLKF